MKIISMGINCGEKTCAKSKGNFCHLFRGDVFGKISCYMFGDLTEKDGWVLRHEDCLKSVSLHVKEDLFLSESTTNERGLKGCPFCGEKEDIVLRTKVYDGPCKEIQGEVYNYIECLPCDAQTGWQYESDAQIEGFKGGREMAIFYWNLRKGVAEKTDLIQSLDQIVNELSALSNEEFDELLKKHENSDITLALINAWEHEE